MLKYAIVGNIASGKSTVEKILKDKGYPVFDTDEIAHKILEETSEDILNAFKNHDISTEGKIDRKKLAQIVFSDTKLLKKLELIIHPLVREEIIKIFNSINCDKIFISVPQLFEAGFEDLFDKIIFISADKNIRLERLMKRNGISKEEALLRITAQMPDTEKIKHSDIIIENNGSTEELFNSINNFLDN